MRANSKIGGRSRDRKARRLPAFPVHGTTGLRMSSQPIVQTISSGSEQRMNIPVVTVESFFDNHAKALQLKLEGERIGFERRIREPTINRPGLALAGFYTYFAEKRVQVLGAAEQSYLKSLTRPQQQPAFPRALPAKNPLPRALTRIPSPPDLLAIAEEAGIAVFRTPMITMKFINAATIALEIEFAPS